MGIKLTNNAFATLAAGINSSVTSITVTSGQGARFPTLSAGDYFYATLIDTSNNLEIVKCTARSTDVLTVVRAQESTTARAYSTGDRIEIRITAGTFVDAVAEKLPLAGGTLTGNLGIGAAPASKLDVFTSVASGFEYPIFLSANNSASAKRNYLQLGFSVQQALAGSETGGFDLKALRNNTPVYLANYEGAAGSAAWKFYTEGTERLRIDTSGNVLLIAAGSINLNHLNTYSNAVEGYQKFPSGIIIQYGRWDGGAATNGTSSFPIAFPNAVRQMIFGVSSNGTAGYGGPISLSQYNWNRASGSSNSGSWIAIGN